MSISHAIQEQELEANNNEVLQNGPSVIDCANGNLEDSLHECCNNVIDDGTITNDDNSSSSSASSNELDLENDEGKTDFSPEDELLMEINLQLPENGHAKELAPNGISSSIINHPAYKTLIKDLASYKEQFSKFQLEINRLEAENQRLEADRSHDIYLVQLETLEKTIATQQRELQQLRDKNDAAAKSKQNVETKLEKMTRQYETAIKDKEAMVMKYAVSEKEVIDQKKEKEQLDKKFREIVKEYDLLVGKLKSMSAEKNRICQLLDNKCYELSGFQKENDRLKEDLNSKEIKIKWTQNKLKMELDTHKETQTKLDKQTQKLQEMREECEQVRRDCQIMIQACQESQQNKAHTLDEQLKEQQAKLIMERHEREDKEETQKHLHQEVENLKKKHQLIIEENNLLSIKVQNLEKERLEYEQNLSRQKTLIDRQQQDVVDLQAKLTEIESIRIQLQHEQERLAASQAEVDRLRLSNAELQQDMASCREREAELLNFTQKLTDKNVRLQSEFSATEAKAQQLECEQGPLHRQIEELESRMSSLSQQLEQEKQQRQEENQLLARHLAERTQKCDSLMQQLEDQKGENEVLRRRKASALKEMTRELQQCRKRLEVYEISSGSNSLGQGSRASSCNSLNTIEGSIVANKVAEQNSLGNSVSSQPSIPLEPDRQMLIERIVKLQRANARKTEKLDFMEEHSRQLVAELQKKTRIVQNYIMREQAGALSSDTMDNNKAELSRHGGIMASVYGSRAMDTTMTLELSLEINRKLQAVLEDTLLKNITLK
ncbi:hypothetical protein L9F63_021110, partial [Diploptera punctata]